MSSDNPMEGVRAAHLLKSDRPELGIVVLGQRDDERCLPALLQNGVAGFGYLLRRNVHDFAQIVRALEEVACGGSALDPMTVETLLAQPDSGPLRRLSATEYDVLRLVARGQNNLSIAEELNVSLGSIEKRVASIFSKLGLSEESRLSRRVVAVLLYLREHGLTIDRLP
jgi:DNA-binding NarL/FixJ family response regulator